MLDPMITPLSDWIHIKDCSPERKNQAEDKNTAKLRKQIRVKDGEAANMCEAETREKRQKELQKSTQESP